MGWTPFVWFVWFVDELFAASKRPCPKDSSTNHTNHTNRSARVPVDRHAALRRPARSRLPLMAQRRRSRLIGRGRKPGGVR
jgi:hypothetical protein